MKVQHQRIGREMKLGNVMTFMANERVRERGRGRRRHHRHPQPRPAADRRHAHRGRGAAASRAFPISRRRCSASRARATRSRRSSCRRACSSWAKKARSRCSRPSSSNTLLLGAVGQLQFEVVAARLASEYKVDALYDDAGIATARWLTYPDETMRRDFERDRAASLATDVDDNPVYLATNRFNLQVGDGALAEGRLPRDARARAAARARIAPAATSAMATIQRRHRRRLRPGDAPAGFLRRSVSVLSRAARARAGQADARRLVVPDALRRHPARLSRSARSFSSDKKKEFGPKYGPSPLLEHHTTSLVFNDPPLHTRVRRLILGALSQRHIAAMEPGLVDARRRAARRDGGQGPMST